MHVTRKKLHAFSSCVCPVGEQIIVDIFKKIHYNEKEMKVMKNVLYQNFFCFASFCSVYLMVSI